MQLREPLTMTPTTNALAASLLSTVVGGFFGSKIFLQITANTNVQAMGYGLY